MNYNKGGCQPQITHLFLERIHAKLAGINHNIRPTLYNHISQMKGRRYGTPEPFLSQQTPIHVLIIHLPSHTA